ncbi:MAG: hypothetical protein J5828_01750, partial [Desulfovibrionaceae bacterium]|nr:hypothetical protein [Desulfovibrionaceae bacterium]
MAACILFAASVSAYNSFTLFVIQPIGALPEGRTVLIERGPDMPFIDSADAMCKRRAGYVSLLCRGMALKDAAGRKIYARFPYSEWL